jgi:GxxExxY protein
VLHHRDLTGRIIGLAIEVHRTVGPGLLEAFYSECLADELEQAGIPFQRQIPAPAVYKGKTLPLGFRADIVVANAVLLEIKAVTALLAAHDAQILTYLRMSQIRIGLLLNFHAIRLKDGLRRFIVRPVNLLRASPWCLVFFVLRTCSAAAHSVPRANMEDQPGGDCPKAARAKGDQTGVAPPIEATLQRPDLVPPGAWLPTRAGYRR